MPDNASDYVQTGSQYYPDYFATFETGTRQRIYASYNTGATQCSFSLGSWEALSLSGFNVRQSSINFGNASLSSSLTPTADTHLTNKKYVDDAIAQAIANLGN